MKPFLSFFLTLAFSTGATAITHTNELSYHEFNSAGPQNFVVGIYISYLSASDQELSRSFCTGTVLGARTVLTAAHCFTRQNYPTRKIFVEFGTNIESQYVEGIEVDEKNVLVNPGYAPKLSATASENLLNDLAIIHLSRALSGHAQVADLPSTDLANPIGQAITILGYGADKLNSSADLGIGYLRVAQSQFIHADPKMSALIIGQESKAGICQGDSGSPALVAADGGKFTVVAIARTVAPKLTAEQSADFEKMDLPKFLKSYPKIDLCDYEGLYFDIFGHLDWIRANL